MTSEDRCEDRVYPRGLRIAGGFRCAYPAKATIKRLSPDIRVCGIHARRRERLGQIVTWDRP